MNWLEIEKTQNIKGDVYIPGSKNSSLALIAAACLGNKISVLEGIPDIFDIRTILKIAKSIGLNIELDGNGTYKIDAHDVATADLNVELTSSFRASYYFVGALLKKCGRVTLGYPGGDDFVERPIDQHVRVFQSFGATVLFENNKYIVSGEKLTGSEIYFDVITSGATINAILLGVLAEGNTILKNCATDPEVIDVCNMLNKMGAEISGAGTNQIKINGVTELTGCRHKVIPDRLIAGSFLMTVGITKGIIKLKNVIPEHLKSIIYKLEEIGIEFEIYEDVIIAKCNNEIRATRIRTGMYPVFNSDLQQPMTSLLICAKGNSLVTEKVFPYRFSHIPQLVKLGADINVRNSTAFIKGNGILSGTVVNATDVRAGTSLILAGLFADGKTKITGIEHIERGYEDVINLFNQAGIQIKKCEGDLFKNNENIDFITTA